MAVEENLARLCQFFFKGDTCLLQGFMIITSIDAEIIDSKLK